MAGRTKRFGFNKFGAGIAGTISDDGGKFTSIDRDVLDAVLAAQETHDHKGGVRLGDPTERPGLVLHTDAGSLPAARTFFYKCSFVDKYGLETKASAEYSVTTPYPLQPPGAPSVATVTGGTLHVGITYYALTLHKGLTETDLGGAGVVTITDQRTAVVTFPAISSALGVTGISVWRQGGTESGFTRVADLASTATSWTDDGSTLPDPCPSDPTKKPGGVNLTNSTNSVTITAPNAGYVSTDPSDVKRWRIYRSTASGVYGARSLLAEVVLTANSDGSGGLVTTYLDDGSVPLSTGIPQSVSQTITPSTAIEITTDTAITMVAPGGAFWRLVASVDGALVTTASAVRVGQSRPLLVGANGSIYEVLVDDLGVLSTNVASPGATDTVYPAGAGPLIASPDGTVNWQLTIDTDGALDTLAVGAPFVTLGGLGGGTGPAGPTGPKGDQGDPGLNGADGTNGTNGTNGTDGVGVPAGGTTGQVLAKVSGTDFDTAWVDSSGGGGGSTTVETVGPETSGYTLQLSDAGKVIEVDSTGPVGLAVFIPDNTDVAFPIGTVIEVDHVGNGSCTFAASGSATLQSADGFLTLVKQYAGATLRKRDTDTWIIIGGMTA